jgi:hypothetical protein
MTEPKPRRRRGRRKVCDQQERKAEETIVEIVFGDPDETPNPDAPADTADNPGQNDSPSQPNRFVFRF